MEMRIYFTSHMTKTKINKMAQFMQLQANRLGVGTFRYGSQQEDWPRTKDRIKAAKACIREYEATGNTEKLVDAANWCGGEWSDPLHPNAHFKSAESNGRRARE